jgi:post-segregation antitoxin (ccd killing protein)
MGNHNIDMKRAHLLLVLLFCTSQLVLARFSAPGKNGNQMKLRNNVAADDWTNNPANDTKVETSALFSEEMVENLVREVDDLWQETKNQFATEKSNTP